MEKELKATSATARKSLGELLLEDNFITQKQLDDALELQRKQGKNLGEILTEHGIITPEELAAVRSVQLNVPLIDLKRHVIQPRALQLIPEATARKHTLIPLDVVGDALVVVMADPENIQTIEDIKAQAKMKVEVALGLPADIERAIDLNYRSSQQIQEQLSQFEPADDTISNTNPLSTSSTPITETLDLLIAQAVKDRASDIHIEPQENRLRIRYRIDGILHDVYSFPLSTHHQLVSRVKILSDMDITEQRHPQDGQFSLKIGKRNIDIRAATIETPYGEKTTLRILDKSLSLFTLPELGMRPEVLGKYQTLLNSQFGMILSGGPTGSGKTTTLYASINQLDRNEHNIMTIEDPIEYRFSDINQTQVSPKAGLTFASGLRAIMRHDPDIIMIGEIRDKETATAATQAALTGHLVFSSIHANDAVGVLFRLMDLGIEPYLISSTLIGIAAQRMVRQICTNCRTPHPPSAEEQSAFEEAGEEIPARLYAGAGCNLCNNSGYRKRTGLFELLVMSEEIRGMLRNAASAAAIREQAIKEGMVTMKQDGMLKAKEGITTVSEVLRSVFSIG